MVRSRGAAIDAAEKPGAGRGEMRHRGGESGFEMPTEKTAGAGDAAAAGERAKKPCRTKQIVL